MVKVLTKSDQELYQCVECGFQYRERVWAEKCEAWCKEHMSCNLEIIKQGIPPKNAEPQ